MNLAFKLRIKNKHNILKPKLKNEEYTPRKQKHINNNNRIVYRILVRII